MRTFKILRDFQICMTVFTTVIMLLATSPHLLILEREVSVLSLCTRPPLCPHWPVPCSVWGNWVPSIPPCVYVTRNPRGWDPSSRRVTFHFPYREGSVGWIPLTTCGFQPPGPQWFIIFLEYSNLFCAMEEFLEVFLLISIYTHQQLPHHEQDSVKTKWLGDTHKENSRQCIF